MAVQASILLPCSSSSPKFPIKVLKQQPWQFQRYLGPQIHHKPFSTCRMKVSMSQFGGETNKARLQISVLKEKLWEAIPTSVKDLEWKKAVEILLHRLTFLAQKTFKDLEWKKAVEILLHRLTFLAQKTLKWSIVMYFIFSSLSDFAFSISRNQELMIPFGLFTGCLISDILNETSQQVLNHSEEKELDWHLIGISSFFVLVKFISTYLGIRGQVFLLHVANGGLMQVVWLWKSLLKDKDGNNREKSSLYRDT